MELTTSESDVLLAFAMWDNRCTLHRVASDAAATDTGRQRALDLFELGEDGIVSLEIHSRTAPEPDGAE